LTACQKVEIVINFIHKSSERETESMVTREGRVGANFLNQI